MEMSLGVRSQSDNVSTAADGRSRFWRPMRRAFSIMAKDTDGDIVCASWYPAGHHFSAEEREAALARYAKHLGLDMPRSEPAARSNSASCVSEMKKAQLASASPSADEQPQPSIKINSPARGEIMRGIMAQVFALYTRKEPAVPSYAILRQHG
jgi:hypothetical protein